MRNDTRPNIVLAMMDATRADRLSCYGYPQPTTPNIDRIAAEGVLYRRAFAPDVWTLPVMASVFTGLAPHEHGVEYGRASLDDQFPTLAGLLSSRGYATWGMGSNAWVSRATRLDRGFEDFRETYRLSTSQSRPAKLLNRVYSKYALFHGSDKGASRVARTAERWLRSRRDDRPFFAFLHYLEPHYPLRPPRATAARFLPDAGLLTRAQGINHHPLDYLSGRITLTSEELELLNRLYDAEIATLDAQIGQLYDLLAREGLLENTVLILFADHGENIGHHGLLDHHFCLYDDLVHVPLIVRYPRPSSSECVEGLVSTQDLFHTILELAGILGDALPGRSLCPEFVRVHPREHVLLHSSGAFAAALEKRKPLRDLAPFRRDLSGLRTWRYKYIEGSDGRTEFYDLLRDPKEQRNLVEEERAALIPLQKVLREETSCARTKAERDLLADDPVVTDRLKALGYLE